jgi:hypothetical protein
MKKLSVVAVALIAVAGIAVASSLSVPWFVDQAPAGVGYPPTQGTAGYIQLKNNTEDDIVGEIVYFNGEGRNLGVEYPDNTFVLPALSTVAFRPVRYDESQESAVARLVPDRPISPDAETPIPNTDPPLIDTRPNGSATISWTGGPNDIQGAMVQVGVNGFAYAFLLPPGF